MNDDFDVITEASEEDVSLNTQSADKPPVSPVFSQRCSELSTGMDEKDRISLGGDEWNTESVGVKSADAGRNGEISFERGCENPGEYETSSTTPSSRFRYKPLINHKSSASLTSRTREDMTRPKLSLVSSQWDVDGDGILNEAEQAVRDADVHNKGYLDKYQVYALVRDQLEVMNDVKQYSKITVVLVGFVVLLAISNLGTSFASAILSQEINTDEASGAVMFRGTADVVGYDTIATTFDFVDLSQEEYQERRARVLQEMSDGGVNHPDHIHRRLDKVNGEHGKVVFDQGKVLEEDLIKIVEKCDGVATVNIRRQWDCVCGTKSYDYDAICGPGSTVVRKAKLVSNRKKSKFRSITEQITFTNGPQSANRDVTFSCQKGWCHGSGGLLQQAEGEPCNTQRNNDECASGLLCYAGEGTTEILGVCTRFARLRQSGQLCDMSLGIDACVSGRKCVGSLNSNTFVVDDTSETVTGTGTCSKIVSGSRFGEICHASYGKDACSNGFVCMDLKGEILGNKAGNGVCGEIVTHKIIYSASRWYVNYDLGNNGQGLCVRECPRGAFNNCGGIAQNWDEYFDSWQDCCKQKLWWVKESSCLQDWPVVL